MTDPHASRETSYRGRPTVAIVLVAMSLVTTLFLYGGASISAEYVHDDHPALLDNPLVRFPPP
ncbi:MAG TPA: hypothetical protein DCQ06_04960, partial [Myxococcales bacterium]|nr:hypothetical protein [Myxococcales bacterium]